MAILFLTYLVGWSTVGLLPAAAFAAVWAA
jgi:hypothetical protein